MDNRTYEESLAAAEAAHEARCTRCGACCGSRDQDPCVHLQRMDDGTYICDTYENRFGVQKTVSGREFTCVFIRDVLKFGVRFEGCGYNA